MTNPKYGQIKDVFATDEIERIVQVLTRLPVESGADMAYMSGFAANDFVYPFVKKLILDKLEKHLGELKLSWGMLLYAHRPWPIHTDYPKGDTNPALAILIPLNTVELYTHTIIFNEESTVPFEEYIIHNKFVDNNAAHLQQTVCQHETHENLSAVSLAEMYLWTPGSVLFWDRKLLHCSDNFIANSIKEKKALVIFTHE